MVFINADVSAKVMKVLIPIALMFQYQGYNLITWLRIYVFSLIYNV